MQNVIGAFSEEHTARITGVSVAQLKNWARSEFFRPSYTYDSRTFSRIYSFRDLVSLRVLNQLRNVHRVSMPELRKTATALAHLGDARWTATTLWVHRGRVTFTEPQSGKKQEITTKQYVVDIPMPIAISDTRREVANLSKRPKAQHGNVIRKKFLNKSALVIEGTRIPVRVVQEFREAGYTYRQIIKEYPALTFADIRAALKCNLDSKAA